jgi:hypothetical protein
MELSEEQEEVSVETCYSGLSSACAHLPDLEISMMAKVKRGGHPNGRKPRNPVELSARKYKNHPANKKSRGLPSISPRGILHLGIAVIFLILIFKVVSVIEG